MTTPGVKGQILNFSRRLSETTFDALSDANNGFLIRLASNNFLKNCLNSTIEENLARKYEETFYDENLRKILNCLELADKLGEDPKMMQVRITAFVNSDLLESLKNRNF